MGNNNQINNTSYYILPNGRQLEDWIMHEFGLGFALGSAIKYVYRAGHKDGESKEKDMAKAMHYVKFVAEKLRISESEVIANIERTLEAANDWSGEDA